MEKYDGPIEVSIVGGSRQGYTMSATADIILQSLAIACAGYDRIEPSMVGLAVAGHVRSEGDFLVLIRLITERLDKIVMMSELGGRHNWRR